MKMSIFLVFLPYLASFFLEILATQIQILLFLNLIFCSFGMSVSCSSVAGIQLSLPELCPSFFFCFSPVPVVLLHLSQFKLTGGKNLFIFAIKLQEIPLKAALRLSFLSFIVCLTIFWLLMTFAAVSILYR